MKIPIDFDNILRKDQKLDSLVKNIVTSFEPILNNKFFFEEYTNHEIEHIEQVLKAAEFIIPCDSFQYIQPKEIAVLILAIVLHDIGMHTEYSTFKALIEGYYDDVRIKSLDKKTWKELWKDYLSELKHWGEKQRVAVLGEKYKSNFFDESCLENGNIKKSDNLIISEFIRIHHARLAHEVALKGFVGKEIIPFGNEHLNEQDKQFVGIVARSHGMNIRDTFDYLKEIAYGVWKNPADMNIVFLMVLL